jgi:hypothetical protein
MRWLRERSRERLRLGKRAVPVADESAALHRQLRTDDAGLAAVLLTRAEALRDLGRPRTATRASAKRSPSSNPSPTTTPTWQQSGSPAPTACYLTTDPRPARRRPRAARQRSPERDRQRHGRRRTVARHAVAQGAYPPGPVGLVPCVAAPGIMPFCAKCVSEPVPGVAVLRMGPFSARGRAFLCRGQAFLSRRRKRAWMGCGWP